MSLAHTKTIGATTSAEVRAKLDHPVIDADGHLLEVEPIVLDYLKQVAGPDMVQRYIEFMESDQYYGWYGLTPEERQAKRAIRPAFWFTPAANTLDRATAMLPGLLRSRLDDFGIDFSVLYPTQGLSLWRVPDDDLRLAIIRAINMMHADLFRSYGNRLVPAAIVPMRTPEEAIREAEFCVHELGMKAIMIEGAIRRPILDANQETQVMPARNRAFWIDSLGLDSEHDYDPVWKKFVELRVSPTIHTGTQGWASRATTNNYMYNHIGHFAAGNDVVCKALFLGGVTRRFPTLRFGLLEGGVGWACSLYNDLIEHWEKRNLPVLRETLDPAKIDRDLMAELFARYGDAPHKGKEELVRKGDGRFLDQRPENPEEIDEWAACGIETKEDIYERFVPNFYFGCEADDRMAVWAFNDRLNQFGARLKAVFSSDIGHWDVPDATTVLTESYGLVEDCHLSPDDYRDFVFTNAVTLYAGLNRDFYKGTAIEEEAAAVLAEEERSRPRV